MKRITGQVSTNDRQPGESLEDHFRRQSASSPLRCPSCRAMLVAVEGGGTGCVSCDWLVVVDVVRQVYRRMI